MAFSFQCHPRAKKRPARLPAPALTHALRGVLLRCDGLVRMQTVIELADLGRARHRGRRGRAARERDRDRHRLPPVRAQRLPPARLSAAAASPGGGRDGARPVGLWLQAGALSEGDAPSPRRAASPSSCCASARSTRSANGTQAMRDKWRQRSARALSEAAVSASARNSRATGTMLSRLFP